MKPRDLFVIILLLYATTGFSQYLDNPSFEGVILQTGPPDSWEFCHPASTPNIQPYLYGVPNPPSDGATYLGLLTRLNGTVEDTYSELLVPLSKDSCYNFKIDLAYPSANTFFDPIYPVVLSIYGSEDLCQFDNLLWDSEAIAHTNWVTYEFNIFNPQYDINYLLFQVSYHTFPASPYKGYMLLDNIRINQFPDFELGNDTTLTLCEADTLVLDAGTGFAEYLWSDGSTNQTLTVDTSGTYWVQVTHELGCSIIDSINITIEEYLPMACNLNDSTYACQGQVVGVSAFVNQGVPPYSYEWLITGGTTQSTLIVADSTQFHYLLVTDHCGNTLLDSIKIIALESPDIDLGNDTVVCPGETLELDAGAGYANYLWSDGSLTSTFTAPGPGTYWVEVSSIFGCSASDTIVITTTPPLPIDIGDTLVACEGETITLNAGNGFESYLWQDNSTDTSFTATTTGVYWVEVSDIYECTATDSAYLFFELLPNVNFPADTSLCPGDEITLNAGGGFTYTYEWQDNSTSQFYTVTTAGTYWVNVFNDCGSDSDTIQVMMLPSPQPDLGNDTTICPGENLDLFPGNFESYVWQDNSTFSFFSVYDPGLYQVSVENLFGCQATDEVYVSFSDYEVNLGADQDVCEGETIIADAGTDFISYLWQDNSANQTFTINSPGTYYVNATDIYGCESTDTLICEFYPYPEPDLGPDVIICEGDIFYLTAPDGLYNYYWNGSPGDQVFEVGTAGLYTLSLANVCDSISDNIQIGVTPQPEVFLGADEVLIPGETIELNAGNGYDSYLWQDGSSSQFYVVDESKIEDNNMIFYVDVYDGLCKGSDTIFIENLEIWVPIAFTPNGDQQNDIWQADPERWNGINKHNMTVFSRWGEKVWESENFLEGWDGKRNGRTVADGTYYWILKAYFGKNETQRTLKGTLTILDAVN